MKRIACTTLAFAMLASAAFAEPNSEILALAEKHKPGAIATLERLVNLDSGTDVSQGLAQVEAALTGALQDLGAQVEINPCPPAAGNAVVGRFQGSGQHSILLMIHYDTVFATLEATKRPFRLEGARAFGPGVADAKGGIVIILYALRILKDKGFAGYKTLTVLFNPDEEKSSVGSRGLIRQLASLNDFVLSYEPPETDQVTVGTNGIAYVHLKVKGLASHAGSAPERGRNAALELAHQLLQLKDLGDAANGTTVNWTLVRAGEKVNIIPDFAEATADMRLSDIEELNRVQREGEAIVRNKLIPETEATFEVENRRPPFRRNVRSENLAAMAKRIYGELGKVLDVGVMRFGTDAGFASTAPTGRASVLETLGLVGGKIHTPSEYLEIDSIIPRLYLTVRLIETLSEN